jgi:serine/threonine-protein kinase RsbT
MQDIILADTYPVKARDYTTAGDASAAIKRKLRQLGVDSDVLRRIAVTSYEAELNMIIHSLGGKLTITMSPAEILLVSEDVGPGIPDIAQALQEGFSTADEEARNLGFGAGMGLPNIKRNADEFTIDSASGRGTVMKMRFRLS